MSTLDSQKKRGWHREDIKAAVAKAGETFLTLAEKHGLGATTVRQALDRPYLNSEQIIADAIGVAPAEIWPERYERRAEKARRESMRRAAGLRRGAGR